MYFKCISGLGGQVFTPHLAHPDSDDVLEHREQIILSFGNLGRIIFV